MTLPDAAVTSAHTAPLTARTSVADHLPAADELPSPVNIVASPRRTLLSSGVAERIDLPAPWVDHVDLVAQRLAAIDRHDEVDTPGSGPVALGALPFDRTAPATLVVPRIVHGWTADGARWTTTIASADGADDPPGAVAVEPSPHGPLSPDSLQVSSRRASAEWCEAVAAATERIRSGDLTKVVLAREILVEGNRPFDPVELFDRLSRRSPHAIRFCVDGFVGASPELLVSRVGEVVRAQPMAGTTTRTGDPDADRQRAAELLSSTKNRAEHQVTIDVVHDALLPFCSYLDVEPVPSVVSAGPVQHLATLVEGRLSRPPASVLELVAALHPTPAVGGWPRDEALALIAEFEHTDRGRYAGPVGWVDAHGNGAWAVGIRAASIEGATARCFAGVGVVADSDPRAELEETRSKAEAILSALLRP